MPKRTGSEGTCASYVRTIRAISVGSERDRIADLAGRHVHGHDHAAASPSRRVHRQIHFAVGIRDLDRAHHRKSRSTAERFDLGLNLKGVPAKGNLEAAGSWNSMCTHRVKIASAKEVSAEVKGWLKQAYEAAG